MNILHIETSTKVCSVAFSVEGKVMFEKISYDGPSHAALAGVFAEEAFSTVKCVPDAVAVSAGPGSYTGLRIGVSLAKGLCMGWGIPLIAVPTLQLLAYEAIRKHKSTDCLYCAMMDARRMEVYSAVYNNRLQLIRDVEAEIITSDSYASYLDMQDICFFGDGAAKCKTVIASERAVFLEDVYPLAANMVTLAEKAFAKKYFVDTAYFEPYYLKDFVATIPKNKVLG